MSVYTVMTLLVTVSQWIVITYLQLIVERQITWLKNLKALTAFDCFCS